MINLNEKEEKVIVRRCWTQKRIHVKYHSRYKGYEGLKISLLKLMKKLICHEVQFLSHLKTFT